MQTKELLQKQIEEKKAELVALENQLTELQKQPYIERAKKWLVDFLNENFQSGKATVEVSDEYTIYYVDGQWVFCLDKKNRKFWIYFYIVWQALQNQFHLKDNDIQKLIEDVVLKLFNCEGYTPEMFGGPYLFRVLKPFN